jgi:hypothetical protein
MKFLCNFFFLFSSLVLLSNEATINQQSTCPSFPFSLFHVPWFILESEKKKNRSPLYLSFLKSDFATCEIMKKKKKKKKKKNPTQQDKTQKTKKKMSNQCQHQEPGTETKKQNRLKQKKRERKKWGGTQRIRRRSAQSRGTAARSSGRPRAPRAWRTVPSTQRTRDALSANPRSHSNNNSNINIMNNNHHQYQNTHYAVGARFFLSGVGEKVSVARFQV